jgi:flagellin-like protein
MMNKKAEMGVGTLIVFIAMLLVAAVAAGVLIQTAGSLQEKSLQTGQQARAQISTNARVIEISASDGRDGNLTDFQEIMKLSPGSDSIKLDQIIFTFNTKDKTSTLKYRGADSICEKNNVNGYNTWNAEYPEIVNSTPLALEEDLDDDGLTDYLYLSNMTVLVWTLNLSSQGLLNVSGGQDISDASTAAVDVAVTGTFSNGTMIFAYLTAVGSTNTNNSIDEDVQVTLTPKRDGEGYFAGVYEQQGTNHVPGNLQRGDIIRFCFESPGAITEDEEVRLNFIPKIGTATLTQFVSPDVISTERVYLYP